MNNVYLISNMDKHIFTCPISKQIFNEPVLCADGYYYERECIEQWLESNNTSPMTNLPLKHKNVSESFEFTKRLQEFIKNNPNCEVYKPDYNYIELLKENKFDEFINTNIKDITINHNQIGNINMFKNDTLVKYFIDNNIEFTNGINSKLIHFICRYSSSEMIKYIWVIPSFKITFLYIIFDDIHLKNGLHKRYFETRLLPY
jgi:hypothetical protein